MRMRSKPRSARTTDRQPYLVAIDRAEPVQEVKAKDVTKRLTHKNEDELFGPHG